MSIFHWHLPSSHQSQPEMSNDLKQERLWAPTPSGEQGSPQQGNYLALSTLLDKTNDNRSVHTKTSMI